MVHSYLPIPATKEFPRISEVQAQAIWLEAKQPHVRLFFKVLWFTGLRINEVLVLKTSNLRPSGYEWNLLVQRLKKWEIGRDGKRRRQQAKEMPIARHLAAELHDYITNAKLKLSDKLFPGHENTYRYQLKQCARRAGIENWQEMHPHLFRHGFAYHRVRQRVHPFVLRNLLGHEMLSTTMGYYTPTEEDLREAVER